jgi:hypothetical protein
MGRDPADDSIASFGVAADQDNMVASAREAQADPSPDPAGGAGDDADPPACLNHALRSSCQVDRVHRRNVTIVAMFRNNFTIFFPSASSELRRRFSLSE